MSFSHDSLQALIGCGQDGAEARLIPVLRRVLRTGCGLPVLVQWVRTALPQVQSSQDRTRPVDPDRAAPPLARLLCATLRRGRPARPVLATETVVGG